MWILVVAYLGGLLTILSPCVLPVVPFIFARSDEPFRRSGLPLLIGMGLSFALFGALSASGGNWVIRANQYGRVIALVVFGLLGLSLFFPAVAEKLSQPFVRLGALLQQKAQRKKGIGPSLLLGASLGLVWAPCAGPILGLILAGAALEGSSQKTLGLLLVFAAGAGTSLSVAIFAGGKVLRVLKKGFGAEEVVRRALGVLVLVGVVTIAFGWDTRLLAKFSYLNTNSIEQKLLGQNSDQNSRGNINSEQVPSLDGAGSWLNSPPLNRSNLKGKVVLIDFWTYSCINCLRTLPYLKAWNEKYKDHGLVIIGVHTPEFAFERDSANVEKAVRDLGITYPVAIDSQSVIWNAFHNQYWPAHYLVDSQGKMRSHHFGEGDYNETEQEIQKLLGEMRDNPNASKTSPSSSLVEVNGTGAEAPGGVMDVASPETYLGYDRESGFSSSQKITEGAPQDYTLSDSLKLNQWGLKGRWKITEESVQLIKSHGSITFEFQARDLHLVLGNASGKTIHFKVTLDGRPPGENHGTDTDKTGNGEVREHRLYQLIRQEEGSQPHVFKIEFLEPDVEAFAFTFG